VYPDSGITVQRTIDKETVNLGDTVTVTISASVTTGDVNKLTYQWYYYDFEKKTKVLIDGAVQNSFTVENIPVRFEYWCLIIDEFDYPHNYTFNQYSIEDLTGCKWPTESAGDDGSKDSSSGNGGGNTGSGAGGSVIVVAPIIVTGSTGSIAVGSADDSTAESAADDTQSTSAGEAATDNSAETSGSTSEESVVKVTTKNVKATVTVETSSDGKVVSAAATATKQAKADGSNYKVTLTSSEIKKITKAAGTGSVNITLKAVDESGKQKYKVLVNSKNLKSSKKLYLYSYNSKTKTYTKADSKTYKVSANGNISVSIKKKGTYTLVTAAEAKKLKKAKKS
jgi:hypothetical protein